MVLNHHSLSFSEIHFMLKQIKWFGMEKFKVKLQDKNKFVKCRKYNIYFCCCFSAKKHEKGLASPNFLFILKACQINVSRALLFFISKANHINFTFPHTRCYTYKTQLLTCCTWLFKKFVIYVASKFSKSYPYVSYKKQKHKNEENLCL